MFSHASASVRIRFFPVVAARFGGSPVISNLRAGLSRCQKQQFFPHQYRFTSAHTANSWVAFFFSPR